MAGGDPPLFAAVFSIFFSVLGKSLLREDTEEWLRGLWIKDQK